MSSQDPKRHCTDIEWNKIDTRTFAVAYDKMRGCVKLVDVSLMFFNDKF